MAQQEEQFLFRRVEYTFAATAREPVPGLTRQGLVGTVEPLIGLREGGQQELKFPKRQPSEGQELPAVILKLCVCHHEAVVLLFRIMSIEGNEPDKVPQPALFVGAASGGVWRDRSFLPRTY